MDYDRIVEGRRRNWDPLKPDEVRQREKEEERARREAERAADPTRGLTGYQKLRQRLMDAAAAEDSERFRRAKRQSLLLGGLFIVSFLAWLTIEQVVAQRARELFNRRAKQFESALSEKQSVYSLEDPLAAFASWRSAWIREDYNTLVQTFSRTYLRRAQPKGNANALAEEYRRQAPSGMLASSIQMAINFGDPEPARLPRKPWTDGDLAIFRSQPIVIGGEEKTYLAALSFDANTGTWRFADLREASYFSIRWKQESSILPLRVGPTAKRYNEEGYEITTSE